jgi:hypothetical protein
MATGPAEGEGRRTQTDESSNWRQSYLELLEHRTCKGGLPMGVVEVDISMSVDGFITGPHEEGAGLGEGGEVPHDWVWRDPDGPQLLDDAPSATSGAVITSRKVYDGTDGWGEDGFYRMPVFVVTHRRTRWS